MGKKKDTRKRFKVTFTLPTVDINYMFSTVSIQLSLPTPTTNYSTDYSKYINCQAKQVELLLVSHGISNEALLMSIIVSLVTQTFSNPKWTFYNRK